MVNSLPFAPPTSVSPFAAATGPNVPVRVRIVSANLLHGMSLVTGESDIHEVVRALCDLEPDVLSIQEADARQARSGGTEQVRAIAEAAGLENWRFVPAVVGTPGETWTAAQDFHVEGNGLPRVTHATYGVGLALRWPVQSWHVIRVDPFRFRTPVLIRGTNRLLWIVDEPRPCLVAVAVTPWGLTTFAATHLSFVPGWNVLQLRRITKALRAMPGPRVLVGDLNLPAALPAKVTGWESMAPKLPTFPAPDPKLQLDHVLLDRTRSQGRSFPASWSSEARQLTFSDHRAVIVSVSGS